MLMEAVRQSARNRQLLKDSVLDRWKFNVLRYMTQVRNIVAGHLNRYCYMAATHARRYGIIFMSRHRARINASSVKWEDVPSSWIKTSTARPVSHNDLVTSRTIAYAREMLRVRQYTVRCLLLSHVLSSVVDENCANKIIPFL